MSNKKGLNSRHYKPKHVTKLQIATKLEFSDKLSDLSDGANDSVKNIFTLQPQANQFKQEKGPKYDKQGELIKYSLVGKADWYNKWLYQGRKAQFDEGTLKNPNRQLDEKSVYRTFDNRSVVRKTVTGSEKKQLNKMKEQVRTKNQLLDEIDSIRSRVEMNRIQDQDQMNDLPDFVKSHFLKQKNLFEKHKQNQQSWDDFVIQSSKKLERDPFYSQLLRSDNYRSKLEAAQTFEVLKSDSERYGTRIWYNTLRTLEGKDVGKVFLKTKDKDILIENNNEIPLIMNQDLPDAFRNTFLQGVNGTIEYIRKPQNQNLLNTLNHSILSKSRVSTLPVHNSSSIPFQSFQSDKYLRDRMNIFSKNFAQQNIISYDRLSELDQLVIQGVSQFEAESNLVLNDKRDGMAIYKKYIIKQEPGEVEVKSPPEEILAMDYSNQNKMKLPLMRKIGVALKLKKLNSQRSSISHMSGMNISNSD